MLISLENKYMKEESVHTEKVKDQESSNWMGVSRPSYTCNLFDLLFLTPFLHYELSLLTLQGNIV